MGPGMRQRQVTPWSQARYLLLALVSRDLKVRYKRSLLGLFWAVAEPLAMMVLFTVVFSLLLRVEVENYPVFVLSGVVTWGFFRTGVMHSLDSIRSNAALVKKIYFPREILPMATVAARGVHFCISLLLLIPLLLFLGAELSWAWLSLPLLGLALLLLVSAVSMSLAGLATLYGDITFLTGFALSGLFYLSPVLYPVSMVPDHLRDWYLLNPIAALLYCFRRVLLDGQWPPWLMLGATILFSIAVLLIALRFFRRLAWSFAEVL